MGKKRAPLESAEIKAREIGRLLGSVCPKGWGFFLVLTSFDGPPEGFFTYMSNVEREDAIKLLRETADKLEKNEPHV